MNTWVISDNSFNKDNIAWYGNKFLIGNGYFGIRGTMEEYGKDGLPAINMAGIYDRVGDKWRESVNAPNGLYTYIDVDGKVYRLPENEPAEHLQELDFKRGVHKRVTSWKTDKGLVTVESERFADMADCHIIGIKYSVKADYDAKITIHTGVCGDVWDINGPHFTEFEVSSDKDIISVGGTTGETKITVTAYEKVSGAFDEKKTADDKSVMRALAIDAKAGEAYSIEKLVCIVSTHDERKYDIKQFENKDYSAALSEHVAAWAKIWDMSEIEIEGDDEAMLAINYSIYHLNCIAPRHSSSMSIPARGLSGQVYKGAVFWDTEMFMLDYFLYTDPAVAKTLLKYRVDTLDGARQKAKSYGFEGAFYAWESHEGGVDACSDYNIVDVFTKRPMRTYFKDKQVHISAAVVYALMKYIKATGDYAILDEGGAETIIECARFYRSLLIKKADADCYEIRDVIGPDEYHERVNNNAYTNKMAQFVMRSAHDIIECIKSDKKEKNYSKFDLDELSEKFEFYADNLYIPSPDKNTGLIEQFDGYFKLEDVDIPTLKTRLLDDKEYWGGAYGIASETQVIKQADVITMMSMFRDDYTKEQMKKNWEYYEPRTEHGSSLSACMYSLLACYTGMQEKAYPFFMKSAEVDLDLPGKLWMGLIYIGGTHPASAGGAWMVAAEGFAGVEFKKDGIEVNPVLPEKWKRLKFKINYQNKLYLIDATHSGKEIKEI